MKTNRWIQTTIIVVIATLLAASGVSNAASPVSGQTIEFADGSNAVAAAEAGQPEAQPGDAPEGLTADDWAAMQDLMREAQYQFTWQVSDGVWAYHAPNRAQDLSLSLTADGLYAARYSAEGEPLWDLGLSLAAYGGQTFSAAIVKGGLSGSRERVEYHWSRDVLEWYVNSTDGIEYGLTLAAPPAGTDGSAVELTFALRGSLTPELDGSGQALRLKDASGETALLYDQLAVYDAAGRSLPALMRLTGGLQSTNLQLVIDDAGAAYPLTVTPLLHSQAAKLIASDAANGDEFGRSVAISGDTVVIGAIGENGVGSNRGAAYLFERNQGGADNWSQVKKLTASDAADDDYFGGSVAISGDTVVVGAYREDGEGGDRGAAYLFVAAGGQWQEVAIPHASDAADDDWFGRSVAISGDAVVVGAFGEDGAGSSRGAAYLIERNRDGADSWGQVTKLTASDAADSDFFGYSVAISGDAVVVGAYLENGSGIFRGAA